MSNRIIDMKGQQFGYLTVIEITDKRASDGCVIWKCKCKCGNECEVRGNLLRRGDTRSCGCLQRTEISKRQLKIIPKGTKFGKLTVLKLLDERTSDGSQTIYQCECECGSIVNVRRGDLLRSTSSCGCIKSKGEEKISQILKENNIDFEKQKIFKDCKFPDTNSCARFDFYINNKYIIEYDGIQHFIKGNSYYDNEQKFQRTQLNDKFKNQWCKDNNIPLIRIPYTHLNELCLEDLKLETSKFIIKNEE